MTYAKILVLFGVFFESPAHGVKQLEASLYCNLERKRKKKSNKKYNKEKNRILGLLAKNQTGKCFL